MGTIDEAADTSGKMEIHHYTPLYTMVCLPFVNDSKWCVYNFTK
jgi:hypothetical protein